MSTRYATFITAGLVAVAALTFTTHTAQSATQLESAVPPSTTHTWTQPSGAGGGTALTEDLTVEGGGTGFAKELTITGGGTGFAKDLTLQGGGTGFAKELTITGGGTGFAED